MVVVVVVVVVVMVMVMIMMLKTLTIAITAAAHPVTRVPLVQECSHTLRAPCREGDETIPRTIANFTAKTCAWSCHWQAALEKFGLAADGQPFVREKKREAEGGEGDRALLFSSKKVQVPKGSERQRRAALVDKSDEACCRMVSVLGHGPCDMQSSAAMFLPVACVPPSIRRVHTSDLFLKFCCLS